MGPSLTARPAKSSICRGCGSRRNLRKIAALAHCGEIGYGRPNSMTWSFGGQFCGGGDVKIEVYREQGLIVLSVGIGFRSRPPESADLKFAQRLVGERGAILDLSDAGDVRSAETRAILSWVYALGSEGKKVAVVVPDEKSRTCVESAGLEDLVTVCASRAEAIEGVEAAPRKWRAIEGGVEFEYVVATTSRRRVDLTKLTKRVGSDAASWTAALLVGAAKAAWPGGVMEALLLAAAGKLLVDGVAGLMAGDVTVEIIEEDTNSRYALRPVEGRLEGVDATRQRFHELIRQGRNLEAATLAKGVAITEGWVNFRG